jgi:hypothetical protein
MLGRAIKSLIRRSVEGLGYKIERKPTSAQFGLRRFCRMWLTDDPIVRTAKRHLEESTMPVDHPRSGIAGVPTRPG